MSEELLSANKLAAALGIDPREVRAMREQGCPCDRSGARPRYRLAEVKAWIATLPGEMIQVTRVDHQEIHGVQTRGRAHKVWPKGKPLPTTYHKQRIPCHNCRRVYDDQLGQAVVTTSVRSRIAYFRCRCCGHRFKMAVV